MEARQVPDESVAHAQVSLRIRHPTIDPDEISAALGVRPEHCFKSGDPAQGRRGLHTQTYWLADIAPGSWLEPVDPSARTRSVEIMLSFGLQRLNARHAFLERIQSDGGDVSLLLSVERGSAADFTLPVAVSRLLVKLAITLELKFDP
jgi:hypothetical protein